MTGIVAVEMLLVWIVCAVGMGSGFEGVGWGYSSLIVGGAIGCFVFNDACKTWWIRTFEKDFL